MSVSGGPRSCSDNDYRSRRKRSILRIDAGEPLCPLSPHLRLWEGPLHGDAAFVIHGPAGPWPRGYQASESLHQREPRRPFSGELFFQVSTRS